MARGRVDLGCRNRAGLHIFKQAGRPWLAAEQGCQHLSTQRGAVALPLLEQDVGHLGLLQPRETCDDGRLHFARHLRRHERGQEVQIARNRVGAIAEQLHRGGAEFDGRLIVPSGAGGETSDRLHSLGGALTARTTGSGQCGQRLAACFEILLEPGQHFGLPERRGVAGLRRDRFQRTEDNRIVIESGRLADKLSDPGHGQRVAILGARTSLTT